MERSVTRQPRHDNAASNLGDVSQPETKFSYHHFMKGVILCGGNGSRMWPATRRTNKHLLPVYNKPMVYHPLSTMMLAGVREVAIVSSERDIEQFSDLLGSGESLGMEFHYEVQSGPAGIVDAIVSALNWVGRSKVAVALGDNFFHGQGLGRHLREVAIHPGAVAFACQVRRPQDFGIVEFASGGAPLRVIEKPVKPRSRWAVPGLYFFDEELEILASSVKPSDRGELEVTDLLQAYLDRGHLTVQKLPRGVVWADLGSPSALLDIGSYVRLVEERQGNLVACPEEIAWVNGWIDEAEVAQAAARAGDTDYGVALSRLLETQ